MQKQKALVFYTYLPPWRIDVFNEMATYFDMTIIFLDADNEGFSYNKTILTEKLKAKHVFWNKGFKIGSKPFRFGILNFINQYKPEVVFSHEYSPTSILLAMFLRLGIGSFKLVITTSDNLEMSKRVSGLKILARSFVLSNSTGIVVYSDPVRLWFEDRFKYLKVAVCPNIQNPKSILSKSAELVIIAENHKEKFKLHDKKVILFIGRLVKVKGLDLLLSAFSQVDNEHTVLVFVGKGKEEDSLKTQAQELGLLNKVIFAGHFDDINLYAWYTLANFFLLPSRYEPFGAVVNEALILGCPVVASKNIGALEFIKEGLNGLVFDPENPKDFQYSIKKALEQFQNTGMNRPSLMLSNFENYVEVFKTIIE